MRYYNVMEILLIVLTILFLFYGVAMLLTRSGVKFYFFWFLLSFLSLFLFITLKAGLWDLVPKIIRAMIAAFILLLIIIFIAIEGLIISGFLGKPDDDLEAVIVLGAWIRKDGTPSKVLENRLIAAYRYLNMNPAALCVTTGGQGPNEPISEGRGMADYLISKGIAKERLLSEEKSTSTKENLIYADELYHLKDKKVAIVTSNFHVYRSVALAKKLGYQQVSGIPAKMSLFYLPNNMTREAFAIVKEWLKGNI